MLHTHWFADSSEETPGTPAVPSTSDAVLITARSICDDRSRVLRAERYAGTDLRCIETTTSAIPRGSGTLSRCLGIEAYKSHADTHDPLGTCGWTA